MATDDEMVALAKGHRKNYPPPANTRWVWCNNKDYSCIDCHSNIPAGNGKVFGEQTVNNKDIYFCNSCMLKKPWVAKHTQPTLGQSHKQAHDLVIEYRNQYPDP